MKTGNIIYNIQGYKRLDGNRDVDSFYTTCFGFCKYNVKNGCERSIFCQKYFGLGICKKY